MEKENRKTGFRKLACRFLKEKLTILIMVLACNIVMLSVFLLYRIDLAPFIYAFILNIFLILCTGGFSFYHYAVKHNERAKLREMISNGDYPEEEPQTLEEEDYKKIIDLLYERCNSLTNDYNFALQDSKDYFTLWVHQIKTPISVLDMLMKDDTQETRACRVELFRIEQYVDMVLNYFRLGSESKDLKFVEVSLDKIIKSCIRKYAPLFINKKLAINYEPTESKMLSDEKWLSFILEQLISNAIKYTNSGSITISTKDGAISVSDTGIGIQAEDLPRIFEKGYTGFNGRNGSKSSGLGLYLCSMAAKKLSLDLSVKSEPGKGSDFRIGKIPM